MKFLAALALSLGLLVTVGVACDDYAISPVALIGTADTPGAALGVTVSGDYAYITDGTSGLQVIDISDPTAPSITGTYDTTGIAYRSVASGSTIYVAGHSSGLQILDVSTPDSPSLTGTYDTAGAAMDVAVAGNYAYVADYGDGLKIVDISDPANPALEGSYDTSGYAYGVAVAGNYAYIADYESGLQIIDVSDPANPSLAGTYDTPNLARDVVISGTDAYVADQASGLVIISVSTPAAPVLRGTCDTSGSAFSLELAGGFAYVADSSAGVQVVDIGDPTDPTLVGSYNTAGSAFGVAVANSHVLLADNAEGLKIVPIQCAGDDVTSTAMTQDNWSLMGVPVPTAVSQSNPYDLFQDDVTGTYGIADSWVMSRYDEAADAYVRLSSGTGTDQGIAPGLGYWFIQAGDTPSATLDIAATQNEGALAADVLLDDALPGSSDADIAHVMLANPFDQAMDVRDMLFEVDLLKTSMGTWANAVSLEGLNANVYTWDHGTQAYVATDYSTATVAAWEGFWLIRTGENATARDVQFTYSAPSPRSDDQPLPEFWRLDLAARTTDNAHLDPHNGLGAHELSGSGYDPYDAFELSPPGDQFVSLFFRQEDQRFAVDYRALDTVEPQAYAMSVRTCGLPGAEVEITWPNMDVMDPALQFELLDSAGESIADMRNCQHHLLVAPESDDATVDYTVRVTRVATAVDDVPTPTVDVLIAAPNPFNPATVISFTMVEAGRADLAVYDLRGHLVERLVAGEFAQGPHSIGWDATGHAAGTYVARLATGSGTSTLKISLVK